MKKHVVCSYGYKLICVDDEFSKPFKSHLRIHAVNNFIILMVWSKKEILYWYYEKTL